MARVTGKNGAFALPTALATVDTNSWRLSFSHPVDDDTAYSDTGTGASKSGSGLVDFAWGCTGWLKFDVASSAPGWGGASSSIMDQDGASVTATAATGCTEAFTAILTGGSINHAKRSGAIPIAYDGVVDGDLTETWDVTP